MLTPLWNPASAPYFPFWLLLSSPSDRSDYSRLLPESFPSDVVHPVLSLPVPAHGSLPASQDKPLLRLHPPVCNLPDSSDCTDNCNPGILFHPLPDESPHPDPAVLC